MSYSRHLRSTTFTADSSVGFGRKSREVNSLLSIQPHTDLSSPSPRDPRGRIVAHVMLSIPTLWPPTEKGYFNTIWVCMPSGYGILTRRGTPGLLGWINGRPRHTWRRSWGTGRDISWSFSATTVPHPTCKFGPLVDRNNPSGSRCWKLPKHFAIQYQQ